MNDIDQIYDREGTKWHPTEKPLDLICYLVEKSTTSGECVYDPFLGSGTTAVACKKLKREYIGSEIDKDYYQVSIKRLEQNYLI